MKKKLLMITLLLAGYAGTANCASMLLLAAAKSGKNNKTELMASGQTKEIKVKKGHKLVSTNPRVVSVHKNKDGSTEILARKAGGTSFLHEIKEDTEAIFDNTGEFLTGVKDEIQNKKKPGKKITVAKHKIPASMHEGEKVYVTIKPDDKIEQDNTKDDDTARIITSHIIIKSVDGTKYHVLKLHAKDDGETEAHLLNKTTGESYKVKVEEKEEE